MTGRVLTKCYAEAHQRRGRAINPRYKTKKGMRLISSQSTVSNVGGPTPGSRARSGILVRCSRLTPSNAKNGFASKKGMKVEKQRKKKWAKKKNKKTNKWLFWMGRTSAVP